MKVTLVLLSTFVSMSAIAGPRFDAFSTIAKNPETSANVATFLSGLKQQPSFQSLFSSYTLSNNSFSLQASDDEHPRVVMFGSDAQLIATFNSDPRFQGGYGIESVEYDPGSRRLAFREIIFKSEIPEATKRAIKNVNSLKNADPVDLENELDLKPEEIEFENSNIAITVANPQKCLRCHYSDQLPGVARYIWGAYPKWDNFFGKDHDLLAAGELDKFRKLAGPSGEGKLGHDRYKNLDLGSSPNFPYLTNDGLSEYIGQPNLRLTKLIAANQAEVYADVIESRISPADLAQVGYALFCSNAQIPKSITALEKKILPQSLAIFPNEEECFNIGSPPMPGRPSNFYCLEGMISWVLARNYANQNPSTKNLIAGLVEKNIENTLNARVDDKHSGEELFGAEINFARFWSKYFSYVNYDTQKLCEAIRR